MITRLVTKKCFLKKRLLTPSPWIIILETSKTFFSAEEMLNFIVSNFFGNTQFCAAAAGIGFYFGGVGNDGLV